MHNKDINTEKNVFKELSEIIKKNSYIDPEHYTRYNVKRGLRNADGTGVLVGLTNIGDVHSYIIDEGEKIPVPGRLVYRSYDIYDLIEDMKVNKRFGFEECCYILLFGDLPTAEQLREFKAILAYYRKLPGNFTEDVILTAPSSNIMNSLAQSVLSMYSYDDNPDSTELENILRQSIELIARFPAMAAYGYQATEHYYHNGSLFIHHPQPELSTAENFLHMMRKDCCFTESEAEILDLLLCLHAEHGGGNNSTFVTHVVSSTGTDTYSAIAAAIGSLKGPKHGGANAMVLAMMEDIKGHIDDWEDEDQVAAYLAKIINKQAFDKSGLIYGMGHAVYTISDPRAILLREKAGQLAKEKDMEEEFKLYNLIEKLSPEVFFEVKRNTKDMCANVDFYSGFVYKMLNIPVPLHTPLFAVSRIAGWCAHRIEEVVSGGRIIRPAYKNLGGKKVYIPLKNR